MLGPSPLDLSSIFSGLIGRKVTFKPGAPSADLGAKLMFGVYNVLPQEAALVVKSDLSLLASFAGSLVGLPDNVVKEHLRASQLDELLRDAIHEVLNIASTVVTNEGRAVFQRMTPDASYVDGPAGAVLKNPFRRTYFDVTVEGYQGGRFSIFSPHLPALA
jgi:hypothetical protein